MTLPFRPGLRQSLTRLRTAPPRLHARQFHASRPNQLINETVVIAHNVLEAVHAATGLSWAVSIPLTAILVRFAVATPLQYWAFSHARKLKIIQPLYISWGHAIIDNTLTAAAKEGRYMPPKMAETVSQLQLRLKAKELHKRWKIRPWIQRIPLIQFPVWLAMMESIRRMVGMSGGLLSIVQGWVETFPEAPQIAIQQSMSSEGALWFSDLLATDPYGILPALLSAVVFTNISIGWKSASPEEISNMRFRKQRIKARALGIFKRTLQMSALLLWPVMTFQEVPAGMLIYWISSTIFATIQTKSFSLLLKGVPMPAPLETKLIGDKSEPETKRETPLAEDKSRKLRMIKQSGPSS
ncbi:hypothetical protein LOZ65_003261 [Ophidiomyces ophidiicola]|nr:hypothetical protein LOZ65_003261 [Ophidiomyces ophidiicola]